MKGNGDERLFSKLKKFETTLYECEKETNHLREHFGFALDRLRALVYETPANNLKAVSRPSPQAIAEGIINIVERMNAISTQLQTLLLSIIDECTLGKLQCSDCNGAGFIRKSRIVRDEEFIGQDYDEYKCENCGGSGFLEISKILSEQTLIMVRPLKNLYVQNVSDSLRIGDTGI